MHTLLLRPQNVQAGNVPPHHVGEQREQLSVLRAGIQGPRGPAANHRSERRRHRHGVSDSAATDAAEVGRQGQETDKTPHCVAVFAETAAGAVPDAQELFDEIRDALRAVRAEQTGESVSVRAVRVQQGRAPEEQVRRFGQKAAFGDSVSVFGAAQLSGQGAELRAHARQRRHDGEQPIQERLRGVLPAVRRLRRALS